VSRAERRVTFWLKTLALIAVAIWLLVGVLQFLGSVRATALLVVASIFFAYLIYPLVRLLGDRLPLVWALVIVYAGIGVVGVAIAQLLVPPLVNDVQSLVKATPSIVAHTTQALTDPRNRYLHWLSPDERQYLATLPAQIGAFLKSNAFDTATKTFAVLLSAVSLVATVIILPILSAYMLLELDTIKESFLGLVPAKHRAKAEAIVDDLDRVAGGFIRGQLIDGAIVGAMIAIMLTIMHVPYALLIGVAAGILNFIPYAGAIIGFIPAVILAFSFNGLTNALIVAGLFAVIQQVDGNFIAPRVLKDNVGLSPFWIVVSILAFTELFGLVGTFVAVPVAAMIRVLREHLLPPPVPAPLDPALKRRG
jgi:predicted PurR-regulated permease PerM